MKSIACAFLAVILSSLPAMAHKCFVVKTSPRNGSKAVPVTLKHIEVRFNAPIRTDSWSFVRIKGRKAPHILGRPEFVSNRVVRLPVALEANTTYAIGINGPKYKNFRLAADGRVSCKPHVLFFTTGRDLRAFSPGSKTMPKPLALGLEASKLMAMPGPGIALPPAKLQAVPPSGYQRGPRPGDPRVTARINRRREMVRRLGLPRYLVMRPYRDRTEGAFAILVPRGWRVAGGIMRLIPQQTGGPFNAMQAKVNFWVFSPDKRINMHWFPKWYFIDPRHKPILRGHVGRSYQGATVQPVMSPQTFAMRVVFPRLHKGRAGQARIVSQRNLPRLAGLFKMISPGARRMGFGIQAGQVKVTYVENGVRYIEIITVVIENAGRWVGGLWSNTFTQVVRAPVDEINKWGPIMSAVQMSIRIDPKWLAKELWNVLKRMKIARGTWARIRQIGREIVAHRRKTTWLINYHQQLNLKGQQLYTNPHTGRPEVGPIWYERRWQNRDGGVIYTNNWGFNPGPGWKVSNPRPITAD